MIRHKAVGQDLVGNGGTLTEAGRKHGYSEAYLLSGKLQKTKSFRTWEEKLGAKLSEDKLLKVHDEGLRATRKIHKIVDRDEEGKPIYDFIDVEDHPTRHKFLSLAYEITGKTERVPPPNGKYNHLSVEQIEERAAGIVAGIIGFIAGTREKDSK